MSLFPDDRLPAKLQLSAQESQVRNAERLQAIRLRMMIGRELEERSIITLAEIGAALGMPVTEATRLLTRKRWRDGDIALLEAAAVRLGMPMPSATPTL